MGRTQEDRKAETRERLMAAAAALFAQEGYAAASIDAIGDAADRTSGAVYAHFGGKQGLLIALLEGYQHDLAAVIGAEFAARPDLGDQLRGLWRNIIDHPDPGATDFLLLEIELWLHAARDPELVGPLSARYSRARVLLGIQLAAWVEDFNLRPVLPLEALPVAFLSSMVGLLLQHRLDPDLVTDEVSVATLRAVLGQPG